MGKKEAYKEKNLQYLQVLSTRADICLFTLRDIL